MPGINPYPEKLRKRVHQLHYIQKKKMGEIINILKDEFPEYAKRITGGRMHSVARGMRMKKGLKPNHAPNVIKTVDSNKKEIIESARKLRLKNYRWQAIVEELKIQFPNKKIPTPAGLANMLKGKKNKNENNQYHITISNSSGVTLNIDVVSTKSLEKLISNLLEG